MEPFTAALLVTSRVTPQSAAQISKPKVYRRVLVVIFSSLIIVVALTLSLPNTAKGAEPSKTEATMEGRVQALSPDIEAYVVNGMKGFDIPGVAIGIVANDRLVYAKGFGVRSKSNRLPVDTHTIFQIGSTTKAFLAVTEAIMVDRGKLRWDDRLADLYPEFQLKDPWVTREFRVFDLLAMRSGLPPLVNDILVMLDYKEAALIRSLRYVEPVSSFRTTFAYTNITHLLASRIVATAAGARDWNVVLQKELLDPLGMKDSTYTAEAIEAAANHANGHRWTPEGTVEVPFTRIFPYPLAGTGDINSNVEDMARWVRMQLNNGTFDGRRIVSSENLAYTHMPKVALNDKVSYALGWYSWLTPNGNILWHDGDALSFGSFVGLVPDKNIGIIVLTNETNVEAPNSLGAWVLDRILGNAKRDYVAENLKNARAKFEATAKLFTKPANPRPFPRLAPLTGNFVNPSFGKVVLTLKDDALVIEVRATGAKFKLVPLDGDIFMATLMATGQFGPVVDLDYMANGFAQFQMDKDGKLNLLRLSTVDGQAYEFTRESAPGSAATHAAVNTDFAGLVDIGGGRKMYLECRGSGSPTVVFASGRGDRADIWSRVTDSSGNRKLSSTAVYPEVSKFTRVCAYDRPGTVAITDQHVEASRSSPVPQPTTAADGMRDLHALLTAAKVPSPYVLVAHSWGGLIARLYAAHYPNDVAGLVFVDALTELLYHRLTPEEQAWWITLNSNYSPDLDPYHQEKTNLVTSFQSLRIASELRRMPVVILTSDQPYNLKAMAAQGDLPPGIPVDFGPVIFKAHVAGQRTLAERLNARLILGTHASHYVHTEQPQLVIDSIREVVDAVRDPTSWRRSETMTAPSGKNP